jgi:HTH-type transcriptional regulator/antitoxin HigA
MTAVAEREYVELLTKERPHVIRTERDYDRAMAAASRLARLGESRTAAQNEYYELLATLIEAFERANIPPLPKLAPLDFLKEAMRLRDVTQSQIAEVLGERQSASAILNGRRQISKAQAKRLAAFFKVDAGLFI